MGVCCSCKKPKVKPVFTPARDPPTYGCASEHNTERETVKTEIPLRDVCFIKMANTISNIKMSNPIKNLVSKRRRRYIQDGYNLDLTYIRENLIAMGFPAEKLEGVYRNHIDDVVKFLECKHKDHYKIYNLCSERSYDVNKFQSRVANYPFDDHNPPKIELIRPFCADVGDWLSQDRLNVAAVHCKAGKGRTGVMVCCYMLHCGQFQSADDALGFYGQMRTHDRKGVTIPSQRRYVAYYADLLREGLTYEPTTILMREIRLDPLPLLTGQASYQFAISTSQQRVYLSPVIEVRRSPPSHLFPINEHLWLTGDIKVEFFNKPKMKRKEKMFHFWFNTFFVRERVAEEESLNGNEEVAAERSARALSCDATGHAPVLGEPPDRPGAARALRSNSLTTVDCDSRPLVLHLHKHELDNAHKDKQHKLYPQEFRVTLYFHKLPDIYTEATPRPAAPAPEQTTPSESSEAESTDSSTTEEDGWDSGETTYL